MIADFHCSSMPIMILFLMVALLEVGCIANGLEILTVFLLLAKWLSHGP
jgi:hypothetical protein